MTIEQTKEMLSAAGTDISKITHVQQCVDDYGSQLGHEAVREQRRLVNAALDAAATAE